MKFYPWSLDENKAVIFDPNLYNEIKITPEMRNNANQSTGPIFVCLNAKRDSSYSFDIVFEDDIEDSQRYSYITSGKLNKKLIRL